MSYFIKSSYVLNTKEIDFWVSARRWWLKKWQGSRQECTLTGKRVHSQEHASVPNPIGLEVPEPPLNLP
jgi:hypothetical protein